MPSYPLQYLQQHLCFDTITIEKSGLIRLEGWCTQHTLSKNIFPQCLVNDDATPLLHFFRTYRPDVASTHYANNTNNFFQGVVCLYRIPKSIAIVRSVILKLNDEIFFHKKDSFQLISPDYPALFDTPEILHRDNIYGEGPPAPVMTPPVIRLATMLPGPLLDFGCGSGAVLKACHDAGITAYGIELNRKPIINHLLPEMKKFVTLYEGKFPLPFQDEEFRSATAIEVIEHIPEYETALCELHRVVSEFFVLTVPDISSIPICHHNNVVPWHLLEGTHVNFFNQMNLERLLKKYFSHVEIARIGHVITNDSTWFTSIVGICKK